MRALPSTPRRYAMAVAACALALLLALALDPLVTVSPFLFFLAAVMWSAWYGGLGPALLATAVGSLALAYFFEGPRHSLAIASASVAIEIAVFALVALIVSLLNGDLRRAYERAEAAQRRSARDVAELTRTKEELQHSRDQLAVILQGVADGITVQGPDGELLYANDAAARVSGYPDAATMLAAPLAEIVGQFELLTEDGRPFPQHDLPGRAALRGERPPEVVLRFRRRATGEERWSILQAAPVRDEGGRVRFVVNVFRDITERRRAELALAHFAALVESSDDAIIGKDLDAVITSWNPGAERLYGYTAAEVVGRSIALIIPPDRPDELPGIMARLRRGERIEHYDTVRVRKDGRRIDVSISIAPLRDAAGAIIGASTIARDITGRRRAEETQRLLADASRAFAEASLDLPAVLDIVARRVVEALGDTCLIRLVSADGQWLEPAASYHPDPEARAFGEAMFAAAPERVDEGLNGRVMRTGRPVLIPVVDQERFRAAIKPEYAAYLERFGTHSVLIVPLRVRGRLLGVLSAARETPGRPYTAEDQALLQELADRAALAVDNARLYQEAQEAIRARDQFLSIASHELRTPITSLKGYAQLLLRAAARDRVDPARLARYLRSMDELVNHLNELTEDLLNVARLRTGQLALQPRPLDLAVLVREVAARYQDHLEERHGLVVEAGAEPCPVVADARRLEQVLTNLLDNALKYSPDGGEIRVSLRREEDGNVLSVRDEGIGLPPGSDDAIFAPFERTSSAEARQIPGLGLGLYISRSIVERHGGRIWAESAGENRGTTVSFWLPCGGGLADEERGTRNEERGLRR